MSASWSRGQETDVQMVMLQNNPENQVLPLPQPKLSHGFLPHLVEKIRTSRRPTKPLYTASHSVLPSLSSHVNDLDPTPPAVWVLLMSITVLSPECLLLLLQLFQGAPLWGMDRACSPTLLYCCADSHCCRGTWFQSVL